MRRRGIYNERSHTSTPPLANTHKAIVNGRMYHLCKHQTKSEYRCMYMVQIFCSTRDGNTTTYYLLAYTRAQRGQLHY